MGKYNDLCLKFDSQVDSNNPNTTIIKVYIINIDNINEKFTLKENLSFKLTITKGIGSYFNNQLISFNCKLYKNNISIAEFQPSKTEEKLIENNISKDKIEKIITFPKETSNNNPIILKLESNIVKDEDEWTLDQKKLNINEMNYSGNAIFRLEISNPINCKLIQGINNRVENSIKIDIYNKLNSKWPMVSNLKCDKSTCLSFPYEDNFPYPNQAYISRIHDRDLVNFLLDKNIFSDTGIVNFQSKCYIELNSGYTMNVNFGMYAKIIGNPTPDSIKGIYNYIIGDVVYGNYTLTTNKSWQNIQWFVSYAAPKIYNNSTEVTYAPTLREAIKSTQLYISMEQINSESTQPVVGIYKNIKVSEGIYFKGEKIPILIEFNRIMDGTKRTDNKQCKLVIKYIVDDVEKYTSLYPYLSDDLYSSALLFLYEVTSDSPSQLTINSFEDGKIFNGDKLSNVDIDTTISPILVPIRMCDAITSINNPTIVVRDGYKERIDILVNLLNDSKYTTHYNNDNKDDNVQKRISELVYAAIIDKESNKIVVNEVELHYVYANNKYFLEGSYYLDVNITENNKEYIIKLYTRDKYKNGEEFIYTPYNILYNQQSTFTLIAIKYVNPNDIELQIPIKGQDWPSKIENIIYNVNTELVEIYYKYNGDADFVSSDDFLLSIENVYNEGDTPVDLRATIYESNVKSYIRPLSPGKIIVKLIAKNGMVNESKNVTVSSNPIEIEFKNIPSIIIPMVFSRVEIIDGEDAKIRYTQNLTEVDSRKDVDFDCYFYNGYYKVSELESIQPIEVFNYKRNSNSKDKNEFTILKDYLTFGPSKGSTPKYTVLIKSKNPYEENEYLYGIAYIYVIAKQIKFDLDCTDKTTYIDNSDNSNNQTIVNIKWKIENIDKINGADVLFQIYKNGQVLQESIRSLNDMILSNDGLYIGSYNLEIENVSPNVTKDIYTVCIKGKNALYKEYSYDSKIFNVYSATSLKILINNEDTNIYHMNNNYVNELNLNNLSSNEIENLRKELNLKANASIKSSIFKEYEDLLIWKASDNEKLTINYFNGVNYQDIEKTIYKYFTPSQKFILSGLKNGEVTLTVTHAQTNMQDKVTVNIETLKDKFYLFKFIPKVKTIINYTDSKNNKRTVTSNDEGMLALYEPNCINSSVYVKSEYNNETYLGTILKINLLSGEKDAAKNMLYPVNILSLRRVALIDIYIKNDDGTPYTKKVKIHGGVYKNDGYCQDALLNGNTGKDGIEIQADNKGHIRINMDSTQFYSRELNETEFVELDSQDKLKFILEIYPSDANYYPTILYIDGNENNDDIVRFGKGVVNLIKTKDNKPNTPFILNQTIYYPSSDKKPSKVTDSITKVGPSKVHPKVKLNTDIMMWGTPVESINEYELKGKDKKYKGQISQNSSIIKYPFSKSGIIRNTIDLSDDKIWINDLEQTAIEFILNNNAMMIKSIQNQAKIINMCNVEEAHKSQQALNQLNKLKEVASINSESINISDEFIKQGIKIISAIGMQGQFFKMALTSTQDPSIYRVFIWAGNTDIGLNIPDNLSIVLLDELESSGIKCMPDISDLLSMGNGTYTKEQETTLNNIINSGKKSFSNTDYSWGLGGYFIAEVEFDYDITKWEFAILGGGFSANASMEYKWTYNNMVGPVPITAYIKVGGGIGANFNIAIRRSQLLGYPWATNYLSKKANDYITRINANVYIRAFAGIGFDVAIVALRIGIFGQIEVNFETSFLSRDYLRDYNKRELNGQHLELKGTVGIEFEVKILFISYEKVLASVSASYNYKSPFYEEIDNYWSNNSSILGESIYNNDKQELQVVNSSRTIEKRNYLDKYERYWSKSNNISKLSNNNLNILQQNAYPNSQPRLSNDGSILIYLSDRNSVNVSDTRLCYSIRNKEGYFEEGIEIPASLNNDNTLFNGFGDCNPKIDGNNDFAVATWIRLIEDLNISEGSDISNYEELYMLNSTEIMLSIWQNNSWNTIRVTKDTTPDLSPTVATNSDSILLAWRNVYANNEENILDFSVKDNIDFIRISKDNLEINETYNLYNGSNGSIKGMDVAMLKDGTSCVVYVCDLSKSNIASEFEVFYSIINNDNEVIKTVRLTRDDYFNENPKISTVTLKSGEEKFVIAYHTSKVSDENILNDIRLAFIDKDGNLDVNILEAISEKVGEENIEVSGKYEFVKVDKKYNRIENLALAWTESYLSIDESGSINADKDTLKVVKFVEDINSNITLCSPINICIMPDRTLVDSFNCYMSDINDFKVDAVLLGTEYTKINLNDSSTYKVVVYENIPIYTSENISNLYIINSTLDNSITIEYMYVDYNSIKVNTPIMILVSLKNSGLSTITKLQVKINSQIYNFENLQFEPNHTMEIPLLYEIGEEINNLSINIIGKTINNEELIESTVLYLDYPDVGISKVECISEDDGIRRVRVTLYNETDCNLAKENKSVVICVYEDADYSIPMKNINFISNDENTILKHQLIINDIDDLKAINEGYYTTVFDFNIREYLGEGIEIPSNGVGINIKAQIIENINNEDYTLPEINLNNNISYYNFESLLNKYKQNLSISVEHETRSNKSTGYITVKNNSLNKIYGRLIAKLLDENNNLIASKIFDMDDDLAILGFNINNNLLISEEQELSKTILFDIKGNSIVVEYFDDNIKIDLDVNETRISTSYNFSEVPNKIRVDFEIKGAGMDNEDPIIGDTRWLPFSYKVKKLNKTGVYECYQYYQNVYSCKHFDNIVRELRFYGSIHYGDVYVSDKGKYIIHVTLKEEEYTSNGWKFSGRLETIKREFIVENK